MPVKLITAWRSCRPRRTASSVLSPSVATSLGECLTRGSSDEYTAMRDTSTSDEFTASVKDIAISPVPRSMRAPRSSGLLVTSLAATLLRAGRSFPARSSKAPADVNLSSGVVMDAASVFCASVRAITTVLPSDASASDAPPSVTADPEPDALRMRTRDRSTLDEVLTSSSNVMYSRPRSLLKRTSTAMGSLLSVAETRRMICTWSPVYPVTAAYVESPAVNVAMPLAPRMWVASLPTTLWSHVTACASIWAGFDMSMICTPLHLKLRQVSRSWSSPTLATAAYVLPPCVKRSTPCAPRSSENSLLFAKLRWSTAPSIGSGAEGSVMLSTCTPLSFLADTIAYVLPSFSNALTS